MKLSRRIPSIACLFLLATTAIEAAELPEYGKWVESQVKALPKLKVTKKELVTGTDGGGELALYTEAGKARKLVVTIGLSNKVVEQTFYYIDGNTVLFVEKHRFYKWDKKKEQLVMTVFERELESRSYFKDQKMVFQTAKPEADVKTILGNSRYFLKVAQSKEARPDVGEFIMGPGK